MSNDYTKWKKLDSEATYSLVLYIFYSGKGKSYRDRNIDQWLPGFKGMGWFDPKGVTRRVVELFCILTVGVVMSRHLPKFIEPSAKKSEFSRCRNPG